jgi:hypothetical protein
MRAQKVISASQGLVEDHRGCGNPQPPKTNAAPAESERQRFEAQLKVANHIVKVLREAGLQCELHGRLGQH